MSDIWFISDTHFSHGNIIKYCSRPYADAQEMDEALIANWNAFVKPDDAIYHLGDFAFWRQPLSAYTAVFDRLNGRKHLVLGNHDDWRVMSRLGWVWVRYVHELYLGRRSSIWLSHYAHRVWPKSHHGSWHVFGHSHGGLQPHGLSFDVGVDNWDYAPVHLDTVREVMKRLPPVRRPPGFKPPWRGRDALALPVRN
ncbi:phosphoesterase [Patescibacteria group bacterium]